MEHNSVEYGIRKPMAKDGAPTRSEKISESHVGDASYFHGEIGKRNEGVVYFS